MHAQSGHVGSLLQETSSVTLAALRAGDAEVFERLFHATYDSLCRFAARYLRDDAGAEDVVQDVFRSVWLHRHTLPDVASVSAYLYGAVRNRVLSVRRHDAMTARVRQTHAAEFPTLSVVPAAPDIQAQRYELAHAIQQIAEQFPERRRECFLLTWRDGLSQAEVAEVLELSPKTVSMHLALAYRELRERLAAHR